MHVLLCSNYLKIQHGQHHNSAGVPAHQLTRGWQIFPVLTNYFFLVSLSTLHSTAFYLVSLQALTCYMLHAGHTGNSSSYSAVLYCEHSTVAMSIRLPCVQYSSLSHHNRNPQHCDTSVCQQRHHLSIPSPAAVVFLQTLPSVLYLLSVCAHFACRLIYV